MAQSGGGAAVACVAERNVFNAARATREEAIDAVNAMALAWAQSVAAARGGTFVSYRAQSGPRADLTPSDNPATPNAYYWAGFLLVDQVCYTVP